MAILKNSRHEKFAQAIFKGRNQTKAAIEAGYKKSRARFTGANLATYSNIKERIKELHKATETSAIASVGERKEVLTEIIRGRFSHFIDSDGNTVELTEENLKSAAVQEVKIVEFVGKGAQGKEKATTIKLYSPIQAIDLLNKMGGDYPPSKVEVEPGEKMNEALAELLGRLRGNKESG